MLNVNNGYIIVPSEFLKFASFYTEVRREKMAPEKVFRILLDASVDSTIVDKFETLFNRDDLTLKVYDKETNNIQLFPYVANATLLRIEADVIGGIYRLDFKGDEMRG